MTTLIHYWYTPDATPSNTHSLPQRIDRGAAKALLSLAESREPNFSGSRAWHLSAPIGGQLFIVASRVRP